MDDEFTRFEHEGWERVADKYDSVWSSLTRQFIPYLVDAAAIEAGMSVLDVACGPGYLSDAVRKTGRQKGWRRFASQLKMASGHMPEEAKSYYRWLRAWLSCRRPKSRFTHCHKPNKR
jgi:ubiquinone/menaquinone biosynthesis C-methylase UbiE